MAKLISAVCGAGAQASGLVDSVLADTTGDWSIRVVTQDLESDKAKAVAAKGVEVVKASLDDLQGLNDAVQGSYGIYGVTPFWAHFSGERERQQGWNIARVASAVGAKHVIWSTLEDTRRIIPLDVMPTLQQRFKVVHFDAKSEVDDVFRGFKVPFTRLLTSFYFENMETWFKPQPGPNGTFVINFPLGKGRMAMIAARDIGKCAFSIFNRASFIGDSVGVTAEFLTGEQIAASISKARGVKVVYTPLTADEYRKLGFPGAEDLGNMFQAYELGEKTFVANRDLGLAYQLNSNIQSFDAWLAADPNRIPLEAPAAQAQ